MKILMVCLGNICRSPMAEGIMKARIAENGLSWKVASAGTEGYHAGEGADNRAVRTAQRNGIDISHHIARRMLQRDFTDYDIIYAMAVDVRQEILLMPGRNNTLSKVRLFMDELNPGKNLSVPDPWYGSEEGFQPVFELIEKVCDEIIRKAKTGHFTSY